MELIIAILILLLALAFIWNVFSKNNDNAISCFCVIISSIMLTVALINDSSKDEPTAMDVYQGKTTLEITYRDSIPVDTIVVFKDEFKK